MSDQQPRPAGERREAVRTRVRTGVKVEIIGRGCNIVLTNAGPGGFAIASDEMLASVSRRDFKFTIADTEWSAVLTAQMAYCLLRPRHDGIYQGRFLTGFTFCESGAPDVQVRIREFLRQIKTP